MSFIKLTLIIVMCSHFIGCATNSKTKWAMMGIAAPFGAGIGASTAPKDEKPEFHAFAWGAAFTAVAAIVGGYYFNDDDELARLKKENEAYKNMPKFELIKEGEGYLKKSLKKGEKPVKWKVYKTDQWVPDGEERQFHRDMMIEKVKDSSK